MTSARWRKRAAIFVDLRIAALAFSALLSAVPLPAAAAEPVAMRIVSLAPSVTEIIFALGTGGRLVGVSSHCDYPAAANDIDKVGTFLQPNLEVILAKRPDLVIAVPSPENRSAVEKLRGFGVRVLVVHPEKVTDVLQTIDTIAADLGVVEAGARLTAQIRFELDAWRERLAPLEKRRVLMVVGRRPLIAAGAGTYQDELIGMAGGVNVAAATGEGWPHLNMETVIVKAPEVIVDTGMGERDAAASAAFWAPFPTIPAVRDGRVVGAGQFDLLRPGPRVAQSLATLAGFIHPELAQAPAGR